MAAIYRPAAMRMRDDGADAIYAKVGAFAGAASALPMAGIAEMPRGFELRDAVSGE